MVDLPLVPVTTILLKDLFNKKIKSISVIILFLYRINCFLFLELFKLMPGLKIIWFTSLNAFFKLLVSYF